MRVEPGQLRRWKDGSGVPFTILSVDRSVEAWNVKFLKADGKIGEYHESTIRVASEVLDEAR